MRAFSPCFLLLLLVLGHTPAWADEVTDAQSLLKRGETARALQRIEARVAAKPQDAQARFLQGVILTELKRSDDAKAVFRQLTIEFPQLPEPYNNLAVLYAASGHFEEARQALEAAIRANPKYGVAYENLGDIYAQLASNAYDKAAAISPNASLNSKLRLARELTGDAQIPPTGKL